MRHLDLFSGIGGFALAAQRVWQEHRILTFCEIEPYCQSVLHRHWPDVPIHNDIKTFDARKFLGRVDLLTGGFPCQPYSQAGRRKGNRDDRALWPEMLRVITECRPRWIVGENVAGFASMVQYASSPPMDDKGVAQATIGDVYRRSGQGIAADAMESLQGIGYTLQLLLIPACATNAPHRRDRIWILAHANDDGLDAPEITKSDGARGVDSATGPNLTGESPRLYDVGSDISESETSVVAYSSCSRLQRGTHIGNASKKRTRGQQLSIGRDNDDYGKSFLANPNSNWLAQWRSRTPKADMEAGDVRVAFDSRRIYAHGDVEAIPTDTTSSRLQGGEWSQQEEPRVRSTDGGRWADWPTQPPLCRRDDGLSNRVDRTQSGSRISRIKSLGNAIVPAVAEEIFLAIAATESALRKEQNNP